MLLCLLILLQDIVSCQKQPTKREVASPRLGHQTLGSALDSEASSQEFARHRFISIGTRTSPYHRLTRS
eukprot:4645361-Amphidinium_carterae.1